MDHSPLDRHENVVLQFSGGKDSLACLMLLSEHLHRITVLWLNTGDPLPEYRAQMDLVRGICPRFIEVHMPVDQNVMVQGWPVDLLPVRSQPAVQHLTQQQRLPLQDFMSCCMQNLMLPMQGATKALKATLVIRGQKLADDHKSPVRSGDVIDGCEYWFPLEYWTDEQVLDFVKDSPLLPVGFKPENTSLDCWFCTAYVDDLKWKQPYLEKHHPEKAAEIARRKIWIKNEIMAEVAKLGV